MNKQVQALRNDLGTLADDARALMAATADVAGQKADEARKRLTSALANAKETCGRISGNVVDRGHAIDEKVRQHPYQAIGIGFGVGALIGLLLARRPCPRIDLSSPRESIEPGAH